jgi:hypothetical protein
MCRSTAKSHLESLWGRAVANGTIHCVAAIIRGTDDLGNSRWLGAELIGGIR